MSERALTTESASELTVVVPLNADGSKMRGARYRKGESPMTGSSQKRAQQEVYIQWLVTPIGHREPPTKKAVAEALGVTVRTLNYWEKEAQFQRRVLAETRNNVQVKKVSTVLEALFKTATDTESARQVAAAKVLLDFTEKKMEEVSAEDLAEMSPAELSDLLYETMELVDAQVEG